MRLGPREKRPIAKNVRQNFVVGRFNTVFPPRVEGKISTSGAAGNGGHDMVEAYLAVGSL